MSGVATGPPSFMNRNIGTETYTLLAGPNENPFNVHKSLLCYYSPFFAAALTGTFREADSDTMVLEDMKADVVNVFATWLYTQVLPTEDDPSIQAALQNMDGPTTASWDVLLTEVYILADRYNFPKLRNDIMTALYAKFFDPTRDNRSIPRYIVIIKAFTRLPDTSPLRHFFLMLYARRWHTGYDTEEDEIEIRRQLPRDFLYELMIEMGEIKRLQEEGSEGPDTPQAAEYQE